MSRAKDYELDHTIPLELGGAPKDERSLRLQLLRGANGEHAKDMQETRLWRAVCAGRVSLAEAQACMGIDWLSCRHVSSASAGRSPPTSPQRRRSAAYLETRVAWG